MLWQYGAPSLRAYVIELVKRKVEVDNDEAPDDEDDFQPLCKEGGKKVEKEKA